MTIARVDQANVEVLHRAVPNARVHQANVEVLHKVPANVRVHAVSVDVIRSIDAAPFASGRRAGLIQVVEG
jgi:hypothetical protein